MVVFLSLAGLVFLGWVIIVPKLVAASERRKSTTLSEVRRRLWGDERRETLVDLMDRNRFVFVSSSLAEARLEHSIEDEKGLLIGSSRQQPRPRWWENASSRFSVVRLEICDEGGVKRVEVIRPPGIRTSPLQVFDGYGSLVGTIGRDGRRRFAVSDASNLRIGAIVRRSHGLTVDYAFTDALGAEIGSISDFRHITKRARNLFLDGKPKLGPPGTQPDEHVLEISTPVSRDLRILMLGAAASVYLTLQRPHED